MRACTLGIPVAANYACIWYDPCLILVHHVRTRKVYWMNMSVRAGMLYYAPS